MLKQIFCRCRFFIFIASGLFSTLFLQATTVHQFQRDHPGSLPLLVSLENVSRDLHLTSLQRSILASLRSDYHAAAMKIIEEEKKASSHALLFQHQLDQLSATYNERLLNLLNPKQRRRLREIERQVLGGTILVSPQEQQLLGLSQSQLQKIETLAQDDRHVAVIITTKSQEGKLTYHDQVMALRKNRLQHAKAMEKILTKEQRIIWKRAQGERLLTSQE